MPESHLPLTCPCQGMIGVASSPWVSENYFPFQYLFLCSDSFSHVLSFLLLIIWATNKSGFPVPDPIISGCSGAAGIWYWQILACSLGDCADQARPAASMLLAFPATSVQRFEGGKATQLCLILVSGHLWHFHCGSEMAEGQCSLRLQITSLGADGFPPCTVFSAF